MKTPFLEKLLSFYEEDPEDPFNVYALALEYQKINVDEARKFFEKLLTDHPEYLPTYYQAAQFFIDAEESSRAEVIFKQGIDLAVRQKNHKAQIELDRAYRSFKDEQMEW